MVAEILSVGTELLMGQIANTDAQYLSRRLSELGVALYRHTTVGDNPARVKAAIAEGLSRADIVITTGGLGPTEDDLTKEMVGEFFGLPMELHDESLAAIEERMRRIGREMTENNRKQAYFPRGAAVMPNFQGTAPGCIVESGGKAVAVLPGPPRELIDMFERQLAPYLRERSGAHIESRFLRIFGVGESMVETKLIDLFHSGNPTLALYCSPGEVTARISARVEPGADAAGMIAPLEEEIRRRLGNAVYAEGIDASLSKAVLSLLTARNETVAFAESCTGGRLIASMVDCPGASAAVVEGRVVYANAAKERALGVRRETLAAFGAVSPECAVEMAEGVRKISGAAWALSTTGVAGPSGGTAEKPVGLVYVGVAGPTGARAEKFQFRGDRDWVRTLACQNALNLLRLELEKS
ncbi:MAG: competence/damage-inducible protein A [Clostridiales bacterium]|nr:competence/damage-inducible protein A [Clostridiales bacterium]